jgi:predicted nucleic acid-binding protein
MYAAGRPHPHQAPSAALLEKIALEQIEAATDVEVFQEILHRYRTIGQWEKGRRAYDLARQILRVVIPITAEVIDDARDLMEQYRPMGARDAVHAAVCQLIGAEAICSYDRDFDDVHEISRIEPEAVLS